MSVQDVVKRCEALAGARGERRARGAGRERERGAALAGDVRVEIGRGRS